MKKHLLLSLTLFCLIFSELSAQWATSNMGNLTSVAYASPTTIVAGGDNGTLLRSTNSGSTWLPVPIASNTTISKVMFPTSSFGYVLDANNILYKSGDAGASWDKTFSFQLPVYSIMFTSKDTGFAGSYQILLRTVNGGVSWDTCKKALAGDQYNLLSYAGNKVVYAQNKLGYYNDHILLRSLDYGVNWDTIYTSIPWSYNLTAMTFVDKDSGYFASTDGYMHVTKNGGVTWTSDFGVNGITQILPITKTGLLSLANNTVYKTTDGGVTWAPNNLNGFGLNDISYDKTSSLIGVGNGTIAKSVDGGVTWTSLISRTGSITTVCFKDALNGLAGNTSGAVLQTTNGGVDWKIISSISGSPINKIIYNSGTYYAACFDGVYTSPDGIIWSPTSSPMNATDVYFSSPSSGAMGSDMNGSAYYTTGWNVSPMPTITKFSFANATLGFGINYTKDSLYKTTNSGASWTNVSRTILPLGIYFLNKDTGFICGYNGQVVRTYNAGIKWDTLKTNTIGQLNAIRFSDKNNGYAVGAYGVIIKTSDGGKTWSTEPSFSYNSFFTIYNFNTNWYMGGDDGIFKLCSVFTSDTVKIPYAKGSTTTFQITASDAWSVRDDNSMLSFFPASGTGSQTVTVTALKDLLHNQDSIIPVKVSLTLSGTVARTVELGEKYIKHDIFYIMSDTFVLDGDNNLDVFTNKAWTATTTESWFTVNKTMYGIHISPKPANYDSLQKIGYVNIISSLETRTIMIVSMPMPPYFLIVAKPTLKLAYTGAMDSIKVSSNLICKASSDYPWLNITPSQFGGLTYLHFSAPMNPSNSQRMAVVVLEVLYNDAEGGLKGAMNDGGMGEFGYVAPVTIIVTQDANPGSTTCSHQAIILNPTLPKLCVGDSVMLTANTGVGFTYQWFADGMMVQGGTNNALNCKKPGSYTVAVNSNNCTVISNPVSVEFFPAVIKPVIAVQSGEIKPCTGGTVVLQTTAAYSSFEWNTGEKTATISVTKSGLYTVNVTDANGCKTGSDEFEINASKATTPSICVVNVDRADGKNVIVWKHGIDEKIKSYVVYKETTTAGEFKPMDTVAYNDYNFVEDFNSNPQIRSNRYRVSAIDSCDVESPMSTIHKTMHLTLNQRYGGGVNLIWENYEGLNIPSYVIYHGDSPTDMKVLTEVPSNIFTYSIIDGAKKYYQIAIVLPESCDLDKILKAESGPYSQSLSNIAEFKGLNAGNTLITGVSAFPNPFSDVLNVQYTLTKTSDVRIEVINSLGQKIAEQKLDDQAAGQYTQILNAESLHMIQGLYTIRIIIGEEIATVKAICR